MQFIHLTDLHYARNSPFQIQLIRSLLDDLKRTVDAGAAPDFLVFSGDLVNNPDEPEIYAEFEEKFLQPVASTLLVAKNKIIFCPGNHDVSHKSIAAWSDERAKLASAMAVSQQALHEHLSKEPTVAYAKAISSGFFDLARRYGHEWENPFSCVYSYPEREVSFVAINSGYACGLEGSGSDRGKLGVSAGVVLKAFQDVPSGHKAYSLMHHTLSDLNEHSSRLIKPELFKFSSSHMFGHVHQPQPVKEMSPTGMCFTVQGGALYERDGQYNGYSILAFAPENYSSATYRTYWVDRHEFDVGTNVTSGGVFYSSAAAQSYWSNLVPPASNDDISYWLIETLSSASKELDKTMTTKGLRETFVEPVINRQPSGEEDGNQNQRFTVQDILKSASHTVIAAASEYGATSLLSFISMAYHEECVNLPKAMVPSFVDARRIKGSYEAAVRKVIRDGLPDSEDRRFKLDALHESGRLVVIIDDINPQKSNHVEFLKAVRERLPRARLIVAIKLNLLDTQRLRPIIGIDNYDLLRVATLSRNKVRTLVEKWKLPSARYQTDAVVDQIQSRFQALGIPRTAAYVAIYLSVLEASQGYDPLNSSTVIENFVEVSLQKNKPQYLFRSSFDYRNQIDYLGAVAERMCRENRFLVPYEEIYQWTKDHFEEIGQEHDHSKLIRHFVDAMVLADEGNSIYFRYNIFLSFFIAHRMQQSKKFRDWLVEKDRYVNYISELDIYFGLSRQDEELFRILSDRFASFAAELEALVTPLSWTDRLEKLTVPVVKKTDVEQFTKSIENQLTREGSPEKRDEALGEVETGGDDVKPALRRSDVIGLLPNWVLSLRAYTVALKNLENIPRSVKEEHLSRILEGWSKLILYASIAFKTAIEMRRVQIGDIIFEVELPEKVDARFLRMFFLAIPVYISELIRRDLGSQKLALQLKNDDLAKSLSDSFLQTAVYADLKLPEYINRLEALRKKSVGSHLFLEIVLLKLRAIFLRLGLQDNEQQPFLTLAAGISADLKGLNGEERTKEVDRYTHELRRLAQVNRLRDAM